MSVKRFSLFLNVLYLQYSLITSLNTCENKKTCQECIRDPSICVWCADNNLISNQTRCKPLKSYNSNWCSKLLQNPENFSNATEVQEFSSKFDHVIQIKPQKYQMKLRSGKEQHFGFSFQAAKDFPVDLYFLFDVSKTMESFKNATAVHSENIYKAIKNMTSNVRLGLGTFVDKQVLPFTNTSDNEQTYSYRHRLKLVEDFKQFKEMVSKTPIGINRDIPEGGLDALGQVMACKDIIGWRNESRKIIFFITDGPYHVAGDGKSAGLFQPYDGKCYTVNNSYSQERIMDYPSIGMINKLASDGHFTIIFLVNDKVEPIYQRLSNIVTGSKITTYNAEASKNDNIVTILKDIYEKISKRIKLKPIVRIGRKKSFQFSFKPDCTDTGGNSDCNVEIGKEQQLLGIVKLLEYDGIDKAVIDIIVEGIGEKVTLVVDVIKSCDCENVVEENSKYCSGEKRVCGTCICNDKGLNDRCTKDNSKFDNSTCIAVGSTEICSQRGFCVYGACQCRDGYEGDYCECNRNSCPRDLVGGQICNGHGECVCGKCKCARDWSGEACDCFRSNDDCKGTGEQICNNHGSCHCGVCKCEPIAEWDARDYQDSSCKVHECLDCHKLQCSKLENCVKCQRTQQDDCVECDDRIYVGVLEYLPEGHLNSSDWNLCSDIKAEVGCYTTFFYQYLDVSYGIQLIATTKKDCTETYYMFGGMFLITLVLLGAGTLIAWKLLTDARDRLEYVKFMQQNQQDCTGPSFNPLYEEPATMFRNPTFRKKSFDINK